MARKERQGQNVLPGFILYDHHQGRVVVPALLSQLPDCALGMRKCRRNIRQVRTMRIIPDPVPSAYCEEISRHQTPPRLRPRQDLVFCIVISLNDGRQGIDVNQSRALHQRRTAPAAMRRASSIAARANAARLLAAYFLSNTFLVFGLTQCVRAQAVQVTGS